MLDFLANEESLKSKPRLGPLLATVEGFLAEMKSGQTLADIDSIVDAFGHCKIQKTFDQQVVKIKFVGPHLVTCGEVRITLGSVTSRLLRSVNVPRKCGTAPMGHMERQLQAILNARKSQRHNA